MKWRAAIIALGGLAGAAVSARVCVSYRAALAAGENPAGVGLGVSHLLYLISFPWSLAVTLAATPVALLKQVLTGADGGPWVVASLCLMPVVAGAGWAWLALWLAAHLGRRRASRDSADDASRPSA